MPGSARKFSGNSPNEPPSSAPTIAEAVAARDMRGMMTAAHSIKGAAANLSAIDLREAAASLERLPHDASHQEIAISQQRLFDEFDRLLAGIPAINAQLESMQEAKCST